MTLVLLLIHQGRTSGGHGLLEAVPRIYQVTPDLPDRRRATKQRKSGPARPTASKSVSSPPGRDLLLGVGRHRPPNRNSKPRCGSELCWLGPSPRSADLREGPAARGHL